MNQSKSESNLEKDLQKIRTLGREGNIMEAGRQLRTLVADHPDHPEVLFLLGVCYSKIGREDLARVWWKKTLEVDVHHFRAFAYLKEIETRDPTNFEVSEEGSGALSGDLENCWDPTK